MSALLVKVKLIIQQPDVDAESVENEEDSYKSDRSLDFHQLIFDYLPVTLLRLMLFLQILDVNCVGCFFFSSTKFVYPKF